jgi:hypothetical protein
MEMEMEMEMEIGIGMIWKHTTTTDHVLPIDNNRRYKSFQKY